MAVTLEHKARDAQGEYQRWSLDAGDTLYVDFTRLTPEDALRYRRGEPMNLFDYGVSWIVTPASGGQVDVEFTLRPDYDPDQAAHWVPHGAHPEIAETTGYAELATIAALRFTAESAGATVEVRSVVSVQVS